MEVAWRSLVSPLEVASIPAVIAFLILAGNAVDTSCAILLLLPAPTGDLFEMYFEAR
jgi:hypothetical protein